MRTRLAVLTAALWALAATPAAAQDHSGTVGPASPTFAWDGGPGTSLGANVPLLGGASVGNFIGCFDGVADCEETLIEVEAAGTLTVTATASDPANDGIDLYLYPSNQAGEYDDSEPDMAEGGGASTTGDEKIVAPVTPGYYMAQIRFFLAQDETYKGTAALSGFAAPPPSQPPPSQPPPAQPPPSQPPPAQPAPAQPAPAQPAAPKKSKKRSKRAACKRKAKRIKSKRKRARALKRCKRIKR